MAAAVEPALPAAVTGSERVVVTGADADAPADAMRGAGVTDCTTPLPARYGVTAALAGLAAGWELRLAMVLGSEPQAVRPSSAAKHSGRTTRVIETS
jgi:hypothetical protein